MRTCIGSILATGIPDVELLLIDDGSVDGSLDVAREYAASYSHFRVYSQANSGPSTARNHGISEAAGEYICFFDGDDYINPNAFTETVKQLKNIDSDIIASDFHRVTDDRTILDRVYQIQSDEEIITDRAYLKDFVSTQECVWNVWRYIFRREFLNKNKLSFREGYNCAEDLEFMVRALMTADKIAYIHRPYYNYRINYGASLTRLYTVHRVRDMLAMFTSAWSFLDRLSRDEAKILQSKISREYILGLSIYSECESTERAAMLSLFQDNVFMLSGARGATYKAAALFVRVFGIPAASRIMHIMKKIKKQFRSRRDRRIVDDT